MARTPESVAIDGPAASGKSSVGEAIARDLGMQFLDTGLMYRAFALAALRAGVEASDLEACSRLVAELDLQLVGDGVRTGVAINGEDVTSLLRGADVEAAVSGYSAIPAVRTAMVARQRAFAASHRAVIAGRDIGTVVLPGAPVKIFLTASDETRAARRDSEHGGLSAAHVAHRDSIDGTRAHSPTKAADDAVTIDTTEMSLDQVIARALELARGTGRKEVSTPISRQPLPTEPKHEKRPRLLARLKAKMRYATFTPAFYWSTQYAVRGLANAVARWKVNGREHVPQSGPLLVVSNHLNNVDPPLIAAAVGRPRRVRYMAKDELFHGPLGWICPLWGAFPVKRFDADVGAMLAAERILRHGGALGMFPEGTRSRSGFMGPPHKGTALIALRGGATVLPCAITGTERLRGVGWVFRRPKVTVTIGEPFDLPATRRPSEAQVSELTDRIVTHIQELLPAAYRGPYTDLEGAVDRANGGDTASQ